MPPPPPQPSPAAAMAAAGDAHLLPRKPAPALSPEEMKRLAAHRAAAFVASGTTVGLGTGSTAAHFLDRLAEMLRLGELSDVVGVPTSLKTTAHASRLGIPLVDMGGAGAIAVSVDGADEVDPEFNLVKGRGGSLLREKMIEGASDKFIVIVDESKMVPRLGAGPVPVEVVPFGWQHTLAEIKKIFTGAAGFEAKLRMAAGDEGETAFLTDNGNYIVDMFFKNGVEGDLQEVSDALLRITGVIEHGMFLGLATAVVVAKNDGTVAVLHK